MSKTGVFCGGNLLNVVAVVVCLSIVSLSAVVKVVSIVVIRSRSASHVGRYCKSFALVS